ncbi:MAG TPA: acylphosphatase [Chitinophagaceae bacterium]|jgi:acylphosphatase|nr:acylphosphatase [Chitinophagaceae bacterium]HMU57695.1 acylphosphatase [Chitinophagaceae bacterium]
MKTIQIIVKGKVQGVYYRQSAKEKAVDLKITGTVQNTEDGDVLIIATGNPDQLSTFTDWCRVGPTRANVTEVLIEEILLQTFTGFRVLRF